LIIKLIHQKKANKNLIYFKMKCIAIIFAPNYNDMETTENSGKWWLYFFISAVVIIIMLIMPTVRPWFWMALPFVVTTFVKAMRIM
jgi:hypothetical protein